jgi:hypothetical protein
VIFTYVSLDEFKTSPTHAIDWRSLVPGATTDEDNDAALTAIILAAEVFVNNECDVDSFEAMESTETFYTTLNRRGECIVRPRNFPITGVTGVRYRSHPSQAWTDVALTSVEHTKRSITLRAGMGDIVVGGQSLGLASYVTPHEFDRLAKLPLTVEVTYTSGYAANAMPHGIRTATILFAAALIKERGAQSVTMSGAPSTMGGAIYDDKGAKMARELLKAVKR